MAQHRVRSSETANFRCNAAETNQHYAFAAIEQINSQDLLLVPALAAPNSCPDTAIN